MTLYASGWAEAAAALEAAGEAYVLATVLSAAGSTPRDAGTKMVISGEHTWATLGGGQLEFLVIQRARELLVAGASCQEVVGIPLAAEARQCCGGSVSVLFEVLQPGVADIAVFGAGHVARALVPILSALSYRVLWIDSRADLFTEVDGAVQRHCVADPLSAIALIPAGADLLVLTHDHDLDFRLVEALMQDWRWRSLGLIGSQTKARRFRTRLTHAGVPQDALARLECPVGLPAVRGKRPMEVAIAIAAGLLVRRDTSSADIEPALDWRAVRRLLETASE